MKILLFKSGAIGDLLMATPLIRQLKTKLNCQLDIVVGAAASVAIKDNPYIDTHFILPDIDFTLKGGIRLACALSKLRSARYDYVFVLDKHWYFNLMARLVGAQLVIGYRRDFFSRWILTQSVAYNDVVRYHGLYYLDLLQVSKLAAADYTHLQLDLVITDADKLVVRKLLDEHKLTQFCIVVNSGGNNIKERSGVRMLPTAKILDLLRLLSRDNTQIVLLGGNIDSANYNQYLEHLNFPQNILNWAGQLTLAQSAYLISLSSKFYTTDCGAMHLGVAMKMHERMVAFFGPTNPQHILPPESLEIASVVWHEHDQELYDPNYQLRGALNHLSGKYFFTQLNNILLQNTIMAG